MATCPDCAGSHAPDAPCPSRPGRSTRLGYAATRTPEGDEAEAARTTPSDDLAPGTMVADYEIGERIGRGGMGTVYAGVHPVIGKRVAVKVLGSHFRKDATAVERFVREARAVNQIRHRNIVDIFAFGNLPSGECYCVMELLEGENLYQRLTHEPPLSWRESFAILAAVCDALAAAHDAGIVHRDLKPDNIFLTDMRGGDRLVKLLDFGIAKLVQLEPGRGLTASGVVMGTPLYMSPEQCRGEEVTFAADIYALGVIMFEMFTGRPPFKGKSYPELIDAHVRTLPPSPRELADMPSSLEELILTCLEKDPAQRPQSALTVRTMIEDVASELGLPPPRTTIPSTGLGDLGPTRRPTPPGGAMPLLARRRRRARTLTLAASGALLAGTLAIVVAWFFSTRHAAPAAAPTAVAATKPAAPAPPPALATATLDVETHLSQAHFTVDGKAAGDGSGRLHVEGLAAGRHRLVARVEGIDPRDEPIDLRPGEVLVLDWRFAAPPRRRPTTPRRTPAPPPKATPAAAESGPTGVWPPPRLP